MEGEAIFHIHDISKVYRMGDVEVHALRGVNFDLRAGEFVVKSALHYMQKIL